ncbi:MAG TPA: heme o synthase [Thermoanaerobaculia bacterium]|nr:heme o synthase [Thermoanaerobaculia bacterium]
MWAGSVAVTPGLRLRDIAELTKSGIAAMVVLTTAVGLLLASRQSLPLALWVNTLLGTALVAGGAGALNQVVEREHDARMRRTAQRPIPSGRMHPDLALMLGVALAVLGLLQLAVAANLLAALLAAATLAGYVFVYTPLKRASSLATVVGAFPGAVPPLIGWAAVHGELHAGAWALFALLFLWQMPHFLSIAWLYRGDYERGGFPMLSVGDPNGIRTARQALFYCAALVPVSLLPSALGVTGAVHVAGALVAGALFFSTCAAFALDRSHRNARRMMIASVLYLPAVLAALALDRLLQ